jgi:hypothetical protein
MKSVERGISRLEERFNSPDPTESKQDARASISIGGAHNG